MNPTQDPTELDQLDDPTPVTTERRQKSRLHAAPIDYRLYPDVVSGRLRTVILCGGVEAYQAGDWLALRPFDDRVSEYRIDRGGSGYVHVPRDTVRALLCEVTHVLKQHDRLRDGWVALSLGLVGYAPLIQMRLHRPTASAKNRKAPSLLTGKRKRDTKRGKKGSEYSIPMQRLSKEQRADVKLLQQQAGLAVNQLVAKNPGLKLYDGMPFTADDALRFDVQHDIESDEVLVRALRIGTLPRGASSPDGKKRGTRRDVHGMVELIADALTGVWWPDDRQVDVATQQRIR